MKSLCGYPNGGTSLSHKQAREGIRIAKESRELEESWLRQLAEISDLPAVREEAEKRLKEMEAIRIL